MIIWTTKCSWVEFRDQLSWLVTSFCFHIDCRQGTQVSRQVIEIICTLTHVIGPISWLYKTFCKNKIYKKVRKPIVYCMHTENLINCMNELFHTYDSFPEFLSLSRSTSYSLLPDYLPFSSLLNQSWGTLDDKKEKSPIFTQCIQAVTCSMNSGCN